jgi:hypothetical protein
LSRFHTFALSALAAGALFLAGFIEMRAQSAPATQMLASVRLMFGVTDTAATAWDGSVALDKGAVRAIQGVRFGPEDSTDYSSSWKFSTRAQGQEILDNGVFVTALTDPESRWNIHTPRGDFSFTLKDLMWGEQLSFLDGAVEVTRVPPTSQLTTSDDDEDFPALTHAGDAIWMSFVRFSHSDRAQEAFQQMPRAPESFDYLARPAGGDRVYAMRFAESQKGWSRPEPVSPAGEDTAGTAIASDAQGRVWVIWSAQRNGNFDIYARANAKGVWGPEVRVTKDAGTDLNPVAVADSKGRVWIAWQGYRNNNLEAMAAVQTGDGFSLESVVSVSPASDWDPAIAAAPNGDVAIAWDTYDRGDYDVFFRKLRADAKAPIAMDPPVAAAATPFFEARASIAFDSGNRLWVAYENSTSRWGKEYGTFDTSGTPLYEERGIRVKVFDGASVYTTSSDLLNVMPGTPASPARAPRPKANRQPLAPNPNQAKNRRPGTLVNPRNSGSLNTAPHLVADPLGGVYLAFRTPARPLNSRSPVGSIWHEYVAYFDGHKWTGPMFIPRTDGPMDAGLALLPLESAHVLSVSAMDHRQSTPQGLGAQATERVNSDLYAADVRLEGLGPATAAPELAKIPADPVLAPDARVLAERASVEAVRNYRVDATGGPYRILRGDFHRHTEYSIDGIREGTVADAYRYMIDAVGLDWGGCCDTDNGEGHEYFWWREQTMADAYKLAANFLPMFAFEHMAPYPEGHRVVMFAKRGVRPIAHLARVPADSPAAPAPDTQMLYKYLHVFGGVSVPHTSATDMGTDWRDRDAEVEPAVEIYEGYRQSYESESGPRAAKTGDAIGNLRPAGFVSEALGKGLRLGFTASSDHVSTHSAFANVLVKETTREAILDAFRKRHIYASTGNIVADVRSGEHLMGDEFTVSEAPKFTVKLIGTAAFAKVVLVRDGKEVYTATPNAKDVTFDWTDPEPAAPGGTVSYYYVRGEQSDGGLVWSSPIWISRK